MWKNWWFNKKTKNNARVEFVAEDLASQYKLLRALKVCCVNILR
jgi:primosomal protein N''